MKPTACLLVHGFGGSPFEVLPVAEALEAAGFPVSAPTLPGHDTSIDDWRRTGWKDWLEHAAAEYERLAASHRQVFTLGMSMGGSICLALAQRYRPAGVATIASPVFLYRFLPPEATDWRLLATPLLKKLRPVWPSTPKTPESRAIAPWRGYEEGVSLDALHSFMDGLRQVRRGLGRVTAPLLAIHSPRDRHVPLGNLWEIARRVRSPWRKAVLLPIEETVTRHHLLTTHRETRDKVAQLCVEFVREIAEPD